VESPFSFFELTRCDPGHGFRALDLFTGEEHEVLERTGTNVLQAGDILYAQLVAVDGITVLEGYAPRALPPFTKADVVELRERLLAAPGMAAIGLSRDDLRDWDMEIRELYLDLIADVLEPATPELHNSDGEPIVFQRVEFSVDDEQLAFDSLKHLALMGQVLITPGQLSIDVNSNERAQAIRAIVDNAMSGHACYLSTEILPQQLPSPEELLKQNEQSAALQELPEVQQALQQFLAAHYESWPSEKLPALGGRTPFEAVKSPAGRAQVEALVAQIERDSGNMPEPPDPAIFRNLRERLGLPV
jgi:hypothetical protein